MLANQRCSRTATGELSLDNPSTLSRGTRREKASQAVFARHLNVPVSLVSQWERGEKRPSGPGPPDEAALFVWESPTYPKRRDMWVTSPQCGSWLGLHAELATGKASQAEYARSEHHQGAGLRKRSSSAVGSDGHEVVAWSAAEAVAIGASFWRSSKNEFSLFSIMRKFVTSRYGKGAP